MFLNEAEQNHLEMSLSQSMTDSTSYIMDPHSSLNERNAILLNVKNPGLYDKIHDELVNKPSTSDMFDATS